MKIAAVKWSEKDLKKHSPKSFVEKILKKARKEKVNILCFPGLFGELFLNSRDFIKFFIKQSTKYKEILICPGSYIEEEENKNYHSSLLLENGEIILEQRQVYLSLWEKERQLSRGEEVVSVRKDQVKMAILLPTDQFYPQVSRFLALSGVHLVLAPSAVLYSSKEALQISGLWQNVQQNLFFAIESGYEGRMFNLRFSSKSILHAPLEISPKEDGILKKTSAGDVFISEKIKIENLARAKSYYNPIRQLNRASYKNIFPIDKDE